MDPKKIGAFLAELRKKKGKSQAEAARDLGISTAALSMYEMGERVPRDNIKIRIADYYKKSVGTIFFSK